MIFNLLWWSIMINFRWNSVIPKRFDFILLLFLLKVSDFETGWFISLLVQKFSSTLLCSLFPQLTFFYKSSKHWILYLYALVSFWIGCNESGRYLIVDPRKSDKALPIGFSSPRCTTKVPKYFTKSNQILLHDRFFKKVLVAPQKTQQFNRLLRRFRSDRSHD